MPEFQRGYVWNREQVRALMDSLYRRYPAGTLLVWISRTDEAQARGDGELQPGTVRLLLDGQQRMTSLYGVIKGRPSEFFEGNKEAFTALFSAMFLPRKALAISQADRQAPRLRGFSLVGAPGFEPGTSSPPD